MSSARTLPAYVATCMEYIFLANLATCSPPRFFRDSARRGPFLAYGLSSSTKFILENLGPYHKPSYPWPESARRAIPLQGRPASCGARLWFMP